jgi:hypothetical protein
MIKGIHTAEFRILFEPTFDEILKKNGTLVRLETTKQFSNFNYQIVITEQITPKEIIWSVLGLRAPAMSMPGFGSAFFQKIFFGLSGTIGFTLRKIDGRENRFGLRINESAVMVKSSPDQPFTVAYTSHRQFEDHRESDQRPPKRKPDIIRSTSKKHPPK